MGYTNLEAKRRGEQALIEDNVFAERERLNQESQSFQQRQSSFDQDIDNATADGIRRGAISNETDMLREFASQGMIDPMIAAQAEEKYQMFSAEDDAAQQQAGLGAQEETWNAAAETQADDISRKLLEAYIQGAPDEYINETLDALNVPDQVKSASAQMFLQKQKDVGSQDNEMGKDPKNLLAQFKAQPSQHTIQANNIVSQTEEKIAGLHQMFAQQKESGPQNG